MLSSKLLFGCTFIFCIIISQYQTEVVGFYSKHVMSRCRGGCAYLSVYFISETAKLILINLVFRVYNKSY